MRKRSVGAQAPWFAWWSQDNRVINRTTLMRRYPGKHVALVFFATWCQPCENGLKLIRKDIARLHAAISLDDLRVPSGNRLEGLKGDRKGQYSIRINDQWRVCFVWKDDAAEDVEIVDYH